MCRSPLVHDDTALSSTRRSSPNAERKLSGSDTVSHNPCAIRNSTSSGPRPLYAGQHGSTDVSPFPELDKYVCNVARPGAQIVKWTFYRALGRISYFLTRNRSAAPYSYITDPWSRRFGDCSKVLSHADHRVQVLRKHRSFPQEQQRHHRLQSCQGVLAAGMPRSGLRR
jgi:hypothetical protein